MRVRSSMHLGLLLFFLWAMMLVMDFYVPWFVLPDVIVIVVLYVFLFVPQLPLWRWVLPISLLMDVASDSPFGFHALFYTLAALMSLPFPKIWRMVAPIVGVFVLCLLAIVLQILRCLLLFLWQGIPASPGWMWGALFSLLLLPLLRWLADNVVNRIFGVYPQ
ncbi:MAG: rod shape-determining protein MreD [Cardiobacteriaceae bacterium]|nr:rod shape-determining protein MreD [Cardiobacteriaceae bacterium]